MRKFLRLSFTIFLVFLISGFNTFKNDDTSSKLLGSWEYTAPSMGLKFQKGALKFSLDQEVLTGTVILEDRILPMKDLVYEDQKVRAYILFDGEQIDIFIRFHADSFQGTVSHPQGYLRIKGNKILN